MTQVLMLVHGMGVHGADWSTDAIAALTTAAEAYDLSDFSEELGGDGVTVVPITYDDRFTKWLAKWGNDSRELAKFIKQNSIPAPANLTEWLENADEKENNFIWSHVVDVILYRFFGSLVTKDVRTHVARDVTRAWKDALKEDPNAEVSVIAHSLGTSVLHDALALVATEPPTGATGFLAGERRLANLFTIANVSRILETFPQAYDSVICPPSVKGDTAYCGNMFNIRHELDPFPAPRPFKPKWGGDDFVQIETTAVRDFNVHGFDHYLNDPRVHIPIFRALFGFEAIDEETAEKAIKTYDAAKGPKCPQALKDFVQDCRQRVKLIEDSSDIKTLLTAVVQFLNDVKEVQSACKKEK